MAKGMYAYPIAWTGLFRSRDRLAEAVAAMLLIGFYGADRRSPSARLLARQLRRGQLGGVFFVTQNIGTRAEVDELVALFRQGGATPLLAIDHEGGIVQRLTAAHGLTVMPCARDVATNLSPEEARALYAQAGRELAAAGFNVNLGPVLDVHDPANDAIGACGRAYGTDPEAIAAYAAAFIDGARGAGLLCTLKHFPGHGRSGGDSHGGPADISATWTEAELEPFVRLIQAGRAPMVMAGHLRLDQFEPSGRPATVSPALLSGLLRGRLGYEGVIVTDDLDMGAVSGLMPRREAVVQAIQAGNDLLMIKNLFGYDPLLPQRVVGWIRTAIARGELREEQVLQAAARIGRLRREAGLPATSLG